MGRGGGGGKERGVLCMYTAVLKSGSNFWQNNAVRKKRSFRGRLFARRSRRGSFHNNHNTATIIVMSADKDVCRAYKHSKPGPPSEVLKLDAHHAVPQPGPDEVLVEVSAVALNPVDCECDCTL